ncbi:hypothetical protein MMC13_006358 [Lambiella insularis]|nr:hypothetical protein [Lambiella insularis]
MVAMTHRPLRNSQLIAFDHVAAGHDGILSDASGDLLAKPCKQAEIDFYESTRAHPDFAYYIPTYFGTLKLSQSHGAPEVAGALICSIHDQTSPASHALEAQPGAAIPDSWTPSNRRIDTDSAIVLENVAAGLRKPNILDVKLGARLWADDSPLAKRQKLDDVSKVTTSGPLGFRIAGMKTWMGPNSAGQSHVGLDGYKVYGKDYGRSLQVEDVRQGFEAFFFLESAGITRKFARKVIHRFLGDLRGLREALEKEESRMYSSSLLFVYEGDGAGLREDFETEKQVLETEEQLSQSDGNLHRAEDLEEDEYEFDDEDEAVSQWPKVQAIKMIDFAHAAWTPGLGPDQNVLHGLGSVIRILEDLLKQ